MSYRPSPHTAHSTTATTRALHSQTSARKDIFKKKTSRKPVVDNDYNREVYVGPDEPPSFEKQMSLKEEKLEFCQFKRGDVIYYRYTNAYAKEMSGLGLIAHVEGGSVVTFYWIPYGGDYKNAKISDDNLKRVVNVTVNEVANQFGAWFFESADKIIEEFSITKNTALKPIVAARPPSKVTQSIETNMKSLNTLVNDLSHDKISEHIFGIQEFKTKLKTCLKRVQDLYKYVQRKHHVFFKHYNISNAHTVMYSFDEVHDARMLLYNSILTDIESIKQFVTNMRSELKSTNFQSCEDIQGLLRPLQEIVNRIDIQITYAEEYANRLINYRHAGVFVE